MSLTRTENSSSAFGRCSSPKQDAEGCNRHSVQEMVDECLDDVAMRLRRYTTPVPRSLVPYLVRALRIHRLALRRSERRRASGEHDGEMADGEPGARLIGSLSQAAVRASAGT